MRELRRVLLAASRRMWRPLAAVIVSGLLAVVMIAVDRSVDLTVDRTMTEGVASAFLATIAGTMITATVVVFWIRGLLISTRTGYVPNRVLSSYLDDPDQQWLMGATVGVFVIASITLLSTTEDAGSRPSITIATVGLATVATLIAIIHSISAGASAMHEQRILRRIVDTTLSTIEREYPDEEHSDEAVAPTEGEGHSLVVRSTRLGWLRSVDERRLLAHLPSGAVCRRHPAVGTFIAQGEALCTIWARDADADLTDRVRATFEVGATRSPDDDISFGIRNLVDIAIAGTVGGADRTSAREAIEHLGAVLRMLVVRAGPVPAFRDAEGRWMIRNDVHDFEAYIDDGLEDLADAVRDARTRRLLNATIDQLIDAAETAGRPDRARLLRHHIAFDDRPPCDCTSANGDAELRMTRDDRAEAQTSASHRWTQPSDAAR